MIINLAAIDIDALEEQPEMVFGNLVKRRSEVKDSTLTPERKTELAKAKDNELNTWMQHAVVEAASRKGIPMGALMKMRWVVKTKADASLKARLVVHGFTDTRLGEIQTSSPTASRRVRQVFLTTTASLAFQCHKGDVKCAFLQGDLEEEDEDIIPADGAQLHEDVFCMPTPELERKLGLEHHLCVRLLNAVYGLVNAPRRWYQRVSKDLENLAGVENETEPCVWTFRDKGGQIIGLVLLYVDDALVACSPKREGRALLKQIQGLFQWETWESKAFTQCGAKITQAYHQHLTQWGGFTVLVEEYASEVQLINLSSNRRADKTAQITAHEQSMFRIGRAI